VIAFFIKYFMFKKEIKCIINTVISVPPFLFIISLITLTAACQQKIMYIPSDLPYSDWVMFGNKPERQHYSDNEFEPPLKLVHKISATSAVGTSPVASNGMLFAGTKDGYLNAFNLASGKKIGKIKIKHGIIASPLLDENRIYISLGSGKETLRCYDFHKGRYVWKADVGYIEASPVLIDEKIFVGTIEGSLLCVDKFTGKNLWRKEYGEPIWSSPASVDSFLVFGTVDGQLHSVFLSNGDIVWTQSLGKGIFGSITIHDSRAFLGTTSERFYSIEVETGKILWEFKTGGAVYSSPALNKELVFFGCSDNSLYALDQRTGDLNWKFLTGGVISAPAFIAKENLYFGSADKNLYCVDANTGELRWQFEMPGRIRTAPIAYDQYLIVASENKEIYVFVPENNQFHDRKSMK